MRRLLVVEDDEAIAKPLARALEREEFSVVRAETGQQALGELAAGRFDIVILDLTLPDMDGLDVCQRVRRTDPALPIVMLTARAAEVDVLVGFDAGADDYITKPFRMAELLARLRARLRPTDAAPTTRTVAEVGGLTFDREARRVWIDDVELRLTPTEFNLLGALVADVGRAVSRAELLAATGGGEAGARTLDMHMSSLRRKVVDASDEAQYLTTVRGIGYRLDPPGPDPA